METNECKTFQSDSELTQSGISLVTPGYRGSVLVVGGRGFIGSNLAMNLYKSGWNVRILDRKRDRDSVAQQYNHNVYFTNGSASDKEVMREALMGVDAVLYFASHSIPSQTPKWMGNEIDVSLKNLDKLLCTMLEVGTTRIIFPSSGGTIYGNTSSDRIKETDTIQPISSYGMGKFMSEELIKFYHRVHGLQYYILRIANVYGCPVNRQVNQGVVDIFLQNILNGKSLTVWGNNNNIRDYIFIDDICSAVQSLLSMNSAESDIFNVGTGVGHSIQNVIEIIEAVTGRHASIQQEATQDSGIPRNVLDSSILVQRAGWQPRFSLHEGIQETLNRKLDKHKVSASNLKLNT